LPKGTVVCLRGKHTAFVKGISPVELEHQIVEARAARVPFTFLHDHEPDPDRGANPIAVDPAAVVALIAVR
jgi:hypothetical protein